MADYEKLILQQQRTTIANESKNHAHALRLMVILRPS
jgi:hypothetical protein